MNRLEILEQKVRELYEAKDPNRDEWADWLFDNHVLVVANTATELAKRFGANPELARVSALLHDIADVQMDRMTDGHEDASLKIGRELMQASGYNEDEVKLVVDDAVRLHSCHGTDVPESLEGKILATADALAHLQTDFYLFATWGWGMGHDGQSLEWVKQWAFEKLDRDFYNKIQFDEVRAENKANYDMLKNLFGR